MKGKRMFIRAIRSIRDIRDPFSSSSFWLRLCCAVKSVVPKSGFLSLSEAYEPERISAICG
jgi:hypothetical protein